MSQRKSTMMPKFALSKAHQWDACIFCGARDDIKTLEMMYCGRKNGCLVTMCKECAKEMVKKVSSWTGRTDNESNENEYQD